MIKATGSFPINMVFSLSNSYKLSHKRLLLSWGATHSICSWVRAISEVILTSEEINLVGVLFFFSKLFGPLVTETQVWLTISQKANIQEMSFDWKGIRALFRRLATWGEGGLFSKSQLWGFCLAQRFWKGFRAVNRLRECSGLWQFLITCSLNGASYRLYHGAQRLRKGVWFFGVQGGAGEPGVMSNFSL